MKGLTFKYIPRDVFGNFQREITLGLYPQNTTINDGTILGLISSDIYGQDAVAVENSRYYLFSDIPPNKYVLIKSGAGVRTEILETALDIPYSGKSTGSDIVWKDNETDSIATKINALENLIIATSGYKNYSILITQTGSADPIVTELGNNIGEIVWTRSSAGTYIATSTGLFTNKTFIPLSLNNHVDSTGVVYRLTKLSSSILILTTTDGGDLTDGKLNGFQIEFKIYN